MKKALRDGLHRLNSQGLRFKRIPVPRYRQDITCVYTPALTFNLVLGSGFFLDMYSHAVIDDNLDPVAWFETVIDNPRLGQGDGQTALAYTEQYSLDLDRHQVHLSNMASFQRRHFFS